MPPTVLAARSSAVAFTTVTLPPCVVVNAPPKSLAATLNVMSLVVAAIPPASSNVVPVTSHAPPWVIVLVVPPPVAIARLPPRVSKPNVTLPASPSPAPLVTVRLSAVIAPIPLISALPSCATPVAPDESKIRFRSLPAFMVIAALIAISSPASKVRSKSPALPEASTSFVTVMSSWACSITLAVFKAVTRLVGEIVDVKPAFSENASLAATASTPPTVAITIFCGSSNNTPLPSPPTKSTVPRKSRYCLPDTSTKPPSPNTSPPCAEISP